MTKWQRMLYQPVLPMGPGGTRITGCREHIELSRRAAGEGMVLLKNASDVLPLAKGTRVALFGKGTIDYVKGGGGSGDVTVAYIRSLYEGMKIKEAEGKVSIFPDLPAFYEENIKKQYAEGAQPGMTVEPKLPEELLQKAKAFADTAVITICRFSAEGWDRKCELHEEEYELAWGEKEQMELSARIFEDGDFNLTEAERAMVKAVEENFRRVVVVLNVGGMVDSCWFKNSDKIQAALLAYQGGMEGGLAAADILCGDVNPSGKLVDTFASSLEAYPSTENFHESVYYVNYTDDIYVGYRYFETIPGAKEKVNYPFGFGLSYTTFEIDVLSAGAVKAGTCAAAGGGKSGCPEGPAGGGNNGCPEAGIDDIVIKVQVTNTGRRAGKEVVQVYYSAPQGRLGKPAKELAAYAKTRLLQAGESQTMILTFPAAQMASYDDLGKVCASAYVLEAGTYAFYVGNSVRDCQKTAYAYTLDETAVVCQLTSQGAPYKLEKRMLADGSYEALPQREYTEEPGLTRQESNVMEGVVPEVRRREMFHFYGALKEPEKPQFIQVAEGKMTLDAFVDQLEEEDLINLLGGQPNTGVGNTWGMGNLPEYGVPNVMTADGPAGLRIQPWCGINTTAWPCATLLASTFDVELIEQVGAAGAAEVKENNIAVWLTPAVNIHRSPLCGRNFEYYSEDPYVAGKSGAAMVKGMQSQHIGASVKHFCCNNKETNRKNSDSRVSERALREIYLKAFEIIVKEADPYTIMSSYNRINGVQASEHRELLTNILRGEWHYKGMVTTDWWTLGEHYREAKAGNDIKMANGYPARVKEALEKGYITREEIAVCAKRILEMILKLD